MSEKNENKLAFPSEFNAKNSGFDNSLTKREYFAGLALQGLLSDNRYGGRLIAEPKEVAQTAINYADALLDQLNEADNETG